MFRHFIFTNGAEYNSLETTLESAHADAIRVSESVNSSIDPVATAESRLRRAVAAKGRARG